MSAQVACNPMIQQNQQQEWDVQEKLKTNRQRSASRSKSTNRPQEPRRGVERSASDGAADERTLKSMQKKAKRSGKRTTTTRRVGGTTTTSRSRETSEERQARKSSIFESVAKQGLNSSTSSMPFLVSDPPKKTTNSPKKGRRPSRSVDQAKIKSPGLETSDTEDSDCDDDKSLDPSALLQKSVSKSHKLSDSRHRSNTSCHGSNRGQNSHEFNKSLDLSSHGGFRNKQGDINTSASDDQWARFKLLGRIGLGEIQPSEAAKLLIRQNVRVLSGIIKRVVALRDEDEDILEKSMHGHSVEIKTGNLLSEVRETLEVKKTRARYKRDPESIRLGRKVLSELEDFVTVISFMYRGELLVCNRALRKLFFACAYPFFLYQTTRFTTLSMRRQF